MKLPPKSHQLGASLIEILVAVLIVTFGIMSMLALQANSVRYNKTSEMRSVASLLAKDMADRMRANSAGVIAGQYNLTPTNYAAAVTATLNAMLDDRKKDCSKNNCTAQEMAAFDLNQWQRNLFFGLPQTTAYIQYDTTAATSGAQYADLWVVWDDSTGSSGGGAAINPGANGCPLWTAAGTYSCVYFRVAL